MDLNLLQDLVVSVSSYNRLRTCIATTAMMHQMVLDGSTCLWIVSWNWNLTFAGDSLAVGATHNTESLGMNSAADGDVPA